MNQFEAPTNDADVQRLFRERDNLGVDSSLFIRAIRQLANNGKPIGQVFGFTVPIDVDKRMLIGLATLTKMDRLVFWPVLPRGKGKLVDQPERLVPDHFTVEFPSERLHVTSYDDEGNAIHVNDGWRSAPSDNNARLLFAFFVRMSVIKDQDVLVSRKYLSPSNDDARRKNEFARFANSLVAHDLPVPGDAPAAHYAYFGVFCSSNELTTQTLPQSLMPKVAIPDIVEDWPSNAEFPMIVGQLPIREHNLCFVAGFPPGKLRDEICFGMPRRQP
jgi:hypothetical protein